MKKTSISIVIALILMSGLGVWWFGFGGTGIPGGIGLTNTAFVEQGKTLYARECAACHGKNLEGQTPNRRARLSDGSIPAPPHDASGHTWHHPDRLLFEITKYGRLKAASSAARSNMPAFSAKLTDQKIWAVLAYIKGQWPEKVRKRQKAVDRQYRARH